VEQLLHAEITDKILFSFFTVSKELPKELKDFFKNAIELEFEHNGLQVIKDKLIEFKYRNQKIGEVTCDFLINDMVLVKLICQSEITKQIEEETKPLLKNSRFEICLILNTFGEHDFKRIIWTNDFKKQE
jgi:GxxExxY protein